MNLRDLEYFKYLAESLSFTKTAEHFFVSQPSISIALKRLEDEFETKLIERERSARNIHLTPTGRLLYQRTIDMLGLFGQTKQEVKSINVENIQLGLVPVIGNPFLPKLLANANEYLHSLKLIEEATNDDLFESLRTKNFSTAILAHEDPEIRNQWLDATLITVSPLKVWVASNHPLAQYKELTINELKYESFISFTKGAIHERLFHTWAKANNLSLENVFYCDEPNTMASLVGSGARVALLTDTISLNRTDLVSIDLKDAPLCYISLVVNNEMEISKAQKHFNQLITQGLV